MRNIVRRTGLLVLCVLVPSSFETGSIRAETWTNLDGDRSIQARMIGMWNNQVVLQLEDGRSVNVPMDKLIAASRIQAGKIAERLKQQRQSLTNEIKDAAAKEAAPAPDPLPVPPAAPAYQRPKADMAPDDALESIREQFQNGHLVVIYDALPPAYRQQLDGLVRLTLTKLDPNSLIQPLSQLHGLADLVVSRQNWILSEPQLHEGTGGTGDLNAAGELVIKFALPAAGLIRASLPTDPEGLKQIQSMGFGAWLHQRDEMIAPYAAPLLEEYSSPAGQWSVVETKDDTALLEKPGAAEVTSSGTAGSSSSAYGESYPGQGNSRANPMIALKRVEGFWVPADVADGFDAWVAEQTAALESFGDASMSLSDWLGGSFVTVPVVATAPPPAARAGQNSYDPYNDPYENQSGSSSSSSSYGSSDGYGAGSYDSGSYDTGGYGESVSSGGSPSGKLEPIAITPAVIGSILQSVGDFQSMFKPLEAATDEKAFHAAAEQLIGSIRGLMSLMGS